MSSFNSISPNEISVLANTIAILLSEGKSADELNVLGNLVAAIGSAILLIAAQTQNLSSIEEKQKQLKDLKKQICDLEKELQ